MGRIRTTIDDMNRHASYSRRAAKGLLSVIKRGCPICGGRKAFLKREGAFCTKCGHLHVVSRGGKVRT